MSQASKTLSKICATCGRQISWRKKWEKNWASIIYCSDSCRKHKVKAHSLDTRFESAILSLLKRRRADQEAGKITGPDRLLTCEDVESHVLPDREPVLEPVPDLQPREGAGALREEHVDAESLGNLEEEVEVMKDPKRIRERCRQAARRLAARGEVLIMQDGKVVDPSFAKGVMELNLP